MSDSAPRAARPRPVGRRVKPAASPAHGRCCRVVLLAACLAAAGCGGDGIRRHRVTGKVTFDGAPVPAGTIYFNPDAAAGHDGPSGFAAIVDGAFDTRAPRGRGPIGGPHTILVDGHVPPEDPAADAGGKVLFQRFELKKDLPASDSTLDVDVPVPTGKQRIVN